MTRVDRRIASCLFQDQLPRPNCNQPRCSDSGRLVRRVGRHRRDLEWIPVVPSNGGMTMMPSRASATIKLHEISGHALLEQRDLRS